MFSDEGVLVEAWLSIGDPHGDELADLHEWLSLEPELRGHLTMAHRQPDAGTLGAVMDLILVSLGSGGVVSVLATSLQTWFAQPRRSDVRIVVVGADGRRVEVDARRVASVEALITSVLPPH